MNIIQQTVQNFKILIIDTIIVYTNLLDLIWYYIQNLISYNTQTFSTRKPFTEVMYYYLPCINPSIRLFFLNNGFTSFESINSC